MMTLVIALRCVICHGPAETIPTEVRVVLKEKYPEDKARDSPLETSEVQSA